MADESFTEQRLREAHAAGSTAHWENQRRQDRMAQEERCRAGLCYGHNHEGKIYGDSGYEGGRKKSKNHEVKSSERRSKEGIVVVDEVNGYGGLNENFYKVRSRLVRRPHDDDSRKNNEGFVHVEEEDKNGQPIRKIRYKC